MLTKDTVCLLLVSISIQCAVSWAGDHSDVGVGCPKDPNTGEHYHDPWCEPQGRNGGAGESSQGGSGHGDFGHGDLAGGDKSGGKPNQNDTPEGIAQKAEDDRIEKEKREVWLAKQKEETARINKEVIAFRKARDDEWKALDRAKQDLTDAKIRARDTRDSITTLTQQARERLALPQVTAQIEKEASEYFQSQLVEAESLASKAESGLEQGLSVPAAKFMADFALDTATSINSFLGGLCSGFSNGFYKIALTATQAAEVVFRNPATLLHLSDNLMQTITSKKYLDTLQYTLVSIAETITSGSAYEKGIAIGDLSTLLIFGIGSLEANTVGKLALEDIAGKVISSETAEELTGSLLPRIKVSGLAAQEIETLEKAAGTTFEIMDSNQGVRHGPLYYGRLDEIAADRKTSLAEGGKSVAETFRSSSYTTKVTQEPRRLFRVDSQLIQLNPETGFPTSKQLPRYYTDVKPEGPLQSQLDSSLESRWGNTAQYWTEIEVPAGEVIHEGSVGEQVTNPEQFLGERLPGGGKQIYIENVPSSWYKASGNFIK